MNGLELEQNHQLIDDRKQFIPENFEAHACVSTSADFDTRVHLPWPDLPTPHWQFHKRRRTIYPTMPITVTISRGESLYFAENEELGIFVTGETREKANNAFEEEVIHFYEHYKNLSWDKVTGEAERLKRLYGTLFKEVGSWQ